MTPNFSEHRPNNTFHHKQSIKKKHTMKNINIGPANLDILEEDSDSDSEVMRVENFESLNKQSMLQGPGMQALMNTKQAINFSGQNN